MPSIQFYAELPRTAETEIREFVKELKSDRKYCISFEKGSETGKEHWQGWIDVPCDTVKNDQIQLRKFYVSKNLDGSKNQWSCAKIKNVDKSNPKNWYSYIVCNPTKVLDIVITNLDLSEFKKELVEYLITKKKEKEKSFSQIVFEAIESTCLFKEGNNLLIRYDWMKRVVFARHAKSFKILDTHVLDRFLIGASIYLEEKYRDSLLLGCKVEKGMLKYDNHKRLIDIFDNAPEDHILNLPWEHFIPY